MASAANTTGTARTLVSPPWQRGNIEKDWKARVNPLGSVWPPCDNNLMLRWRGKHVRWRQSHVRPLTDLWPQVPELCVDSFLILSVVFVGVIDKHLKIDIHTECRADWADITPCTTTSDCDVGASPRSLQPQSCARTLSRMRSSAWSEGCAPQRGCVPDHACPFKQQLSCYSSDTAIMAPKVLGCTTSCSS